MIFNNVQQEEMEAARLRMSFSEWWNDRDQAAGAGKSLHQSAGPHTTHSCRPRSFVLFHRLAPGALITSAVWYWPGNKCPHQSRPRAPQRWIVQRRCGGCLIAADQGVGLCFRVCIPLPRRACDVWSAATQELRGPCGRLYGRRDGRTEEAPVWHTGSRREETHSCFSNYVRDNDTVSGNADTTRCRMVK